MASSINSLRGSVRTCLSQVTTSSAPRSLASRSSLRQAAPLYRHFHATTATALPPTGSPKVKLGPPKSKDRGPESKEDTQTDFAAMNVLANTPAPTTAIDACAHDGFALNSGLKIAGSGVMLVGGDAFNWKPWIREGRKEGTIGEGATGDDNKGVSSVGGSLRNSKGQWEVAEQSWGLLDLVWPKPGALQQLFASVISTLKHKLLTVLSQTCSSWALALRLCPCRKRRESTSATWVSASKLPTRVMRHLNSIFWPLNVVSNRSLRLWCPLAGKSAVEGGDLSDMLSALSSTSRAESLGQCRILP